MLIFLRNVGFVGVFFNSIEHEVLRMSTVITCPIGCPVAFFCLDSVFYNINKLDSDLVKMYMTIRSRMSCIKDQMGLNLQE